MTLNNEYLDILVADNPLYKSIPHEYRYKKEGQSEVVNKKQTLKKNYLKPS